MYLIFMACRATSMIASMGLNLYYACHKFCIIPTEGLGHGMACNRTCVHLGYTDHINKDACMLARAIIGIFISPIYLVMLYSLLHQSSFHHHLLLAAIIIGIQIK